MSNLMLYGKTAIVTGASKGIGKRIKEVLEQNGAIVYDFSRTSGIDILNYADIERGLRQLNGRKVDILINNAGLFEMGRIDNTKYELIPTNIIGTMKCIEIISLIMVRFQYGKIVNISSIDGVKGYAQHSEYAATKGAIISMTRSLAVELARFNINVNCISPGFIRTEMTEIYHQNEKMHNIMVNASPFKRLTTIDDVAYTVLFLVSDYSKNITGQNIIVDAGVTC